MVGTVMHLFFNFLLLSNSYLANRLRALSKFNKNDQIYPSLTCLTKSERASNKAEHTATLVWGGRGSVGEGHQSIWAGVVSLERLKMLRKYNGDQLTD